MPIGAQDDFAPRPGINSPDSGVPVTPSDTVGHGFLATCFWVGGTGNISLMNAAGAPVIYYGVPGGAYFTARSTRINATGTTATNIVACR